MWVGTFETSIIRIMQLEKLNFQHLLLNLKKFFSLYTSHSNFCKIFAKLVLVILWKRLLTPKLNYLEFCRLSQSFVFFVSIWKNVEFKMIELFKGTLDLLHRILTLISLWFSSKLLVKKDSNSLWLPSDWLKRVTIALTFALHHPLNMWPKCILVGFLINYFTISTKKHNKNALKPEKYTHLHYFLKCNFFF